MLTTAAPYVTIGERDPLVLRVRTVLNMLGSDQLDRGMAEVLRGIQRAHKIPTTGNIDEQTLAALDMLAY